MKRLSMDEAMDDLDCDVVRLRKTLAQFEHLNRRFSHYRVLLSKWVLGDMAKTPGRKFRLLDVGCGGGDIAAWLVTEAKRRGLSLTVTAVDSHPTVMAFARERLANFPMVRCVQANVLEDCSLLEDCDYVFGNHFLHHLPDEDIRKFLILLAQSPVRRFVFDDLCRSVISYGFWSLFGPLLYPGGFTASDGCISIRRGFRKRELIELMQTLPGSPEVSVVHTSLFRIAIIGKGTHHK